MSTAEVATYATQQPTPPQLTSLNRGEVLIAQRDFETALERDYALITGDSPNDQTRRTFSRMVVAVNRNHPETYLSHGVQNSVNKAFESGVRQLRWDLAKIQAHGVPAIKAFRRQDSVRGLLQSMNIRAVEIDVLACVKRAITTVTNNGHESITPTLPPARPTPTEAGEARPEAPAPQPQATPPTRLRPEFQMAVEKGDISQADAERRLQQQQHQREKLQDSELAKVPQHLPSFVSRGLLSQDEADAVKALSDVDEREKSREISSAQANAARNGIMASKDRDGLGKKVRKAIEESLKYLEVFEAMKKIHTQHDEAFRLLIQHKRMVVADDETDDRGPLVRSLIDNKGLLGAMVDIMERKDPELRLLDVRLPPYNQITQRFLEKIENLTIEESFIDDLRNLKMDEMSERLNSSDNPERTRPATDMKCFIHLIDHVTKRTRFRRKIRMLRVAQALEEYNESIQEIYRSTENAKEATDEANQFLNRRLGRLFSDTSPDEVKEIKQRTSAALTAAENSAQPAHTNEVDVLLTAAAPEPS